MRSIVTLLTALLVITGFSACHTQEKLLRSHDVNLKLTAANKYYSEGKWMRANELYQSLMPVFRGTKNYEELCYRYCYSFYNMKDYLSASYQFKNFVEAFPDSKRADECEFMYATCMFKLSPRYDLDQTSTKKAISVLQAYIDSHPNSPNLVKANHYIEICHEKLEKKAAAHAKLYYDMEDYKAATIAYQSLIQQFPASPKGDLYLLMRQKSFFKYAEESVTGKQAERYKQSLQIFKEFKQYYPQSKYMKEALALKSDAEKIINKLDTSKK